MPMDDPFRVNGSSIGIYTVTRLSIAYNEYIQLQPSRLWFDVALVHFKIEALDVRSVCVMKWCPVFNLHIEG